MIITITTSTLEYFKFSVEVFVQNRGILYGREQSRRYFRKEFFAVPPILGCVREIMLHRLKVYKAIFWSPLTGIVTTLYAGLSALTFLRDNFLSPEVQTRYQFLKLLPSWSLLQWIALTLFFLWMLTLEGAYKLISSQSTELKSKHTRDKIIAQLNEYVSAGNQLVIKIERFNDPEVQHIFDVQDETENWVTSVHSFLRDALPQRASSFLGDFEKFRQSWQERREDAQHLARVEVTYVMSGIAVRQQLASLVQIKIHWIENLLGQM